MNHKVLIIGIDGGTWTILRPAMAEGYMPYLKRLVDEGASGVLESTVPAITPAAWGSFQTGVNPGQHGVYNFQCWDKQNNPHFVSSKDLPITLWEYVGSSGKQVGVLNVPMTYPPRKIDNGFMVTGVLTPSIEAEFTWPPELKRELMEAIPDYDILTLDVAHVKPSELPFETFVEVMVKNIECRGKAAAFLIGKGLLDLFMVHYHASDIIQHAFMCYLDKEHPLYDEEKSKYLFENFYQKLDQMIERTHKAFGEKNGRDHLLLIVSDHGFQSHMREWHIRPWLYKEGFNNAPGAKSSDSVALAKKIGLGKLIRPFLPKKSVDRIEKKVKLKPYVNRVAFRCSCREGFVYLKEEDPQLREKTKHDLIKKLSRFKDPKTGRMIIEKVYCKEDIYHGRCLDKMPDLVLVPSAGYSLSDQVPPGGEWFHTISIDTDMHVGTHHKDGVLIAHGNGVPVRQNITASIVDIMPTVMYYLGLSAPDVCDGQIITDIFMREFLDENPQEACIKLDMIHENNDQIDTYWSEDKKELEDRLKDLGYM
ncbi:MAG: alkaline phosphatase family protein [Phycisphaerae bacterium]|nr:alkaline phosphatase family protein [Phycisphaerae bacterium]